MQELFRRLPGVDQLLDEPFIQALMTALPRSLVLGAVRQTLDDLRDDIKKQAGDAGPPDLSRPAVLARIEKKAHELAQPSFRRVVNATGVIIHTNLGRSPLAEAALQAIETAGRNYSNLEFDLSEGMRGSRYSHVEGLLCDLTGAEAGLVVNNNAAAVLLVLETLSKGKEAIVSRGELVEIGGSFRIPEVMASSGAIMVEVGATNKTHLRDYEEAITDQTAVLLKVHQSNFHIIGFTEQVPVADLVELGRSKSLPVIEDLGSGSLVDFSAYGLIKEPTVQDTIADGVALATFSGDKLLGGPQAGIILGQKGYIDRIKTNPINRAMRIDKFTLASLEATLRLYLDEEKAIEQVPILRMITMSYRELRKKATALKRKLTPVAEGLAEVDMADGWSKIGGGALPVQELKTRLVRLLPFKITVNDLEAWLRLRPVPILGRIEHDRLVFDVRTMLKGDSDFLIQALTELAAKEIE
ncbi:MAG: L-seryl-tRNA(Sec) selenium transferase [Deltaproteobacteria bacterium]|nr:L-seryl-tRNA(Sec) selenium transferase [Deltaproteobacteria bacterium]MBW2051441.1 L-seryl-tRNA(Sec) selenium transferase [Deltaproteobacteria bacterium]MBW2140900.1 L-seryl-tRNA(Sec) selenium transferase [Deltaproteobacteria bacterium]MBW2323340.1 L-seryl-tRNA(Sec) selenium transferase [Deltaproteobacteria bacterium]